MNDFVLHGFCQKCDTPWKFDLYQELGKAKLCDDYQSCKPVWFLSTNQMKMIQKSDEFFEWVGKSASGSYLEDCARLLDKNPFLVAKILSEAEKDS